MLGSTLKILILFAIMFCFSSLNAQRTFFVDKDKLDSLDYGKYKIFIIDTSFALKSIGRQIVFSKAFRPDTTQITKAEKALRSQYYAASVKRLDEQWQEMRKDKDSYDWKLAVKQHKKSRPKLLASFKRIQKQELDNYDRYYYGYITESGERILLILFDPHEVKYFTVADESHVSNLPAMYYAVDSQELSL